MSRGHREKKTPLKLRPKESGQDAGGDQVITAERGVPQILVANLATATVQ